MSHFIASQLTFLFLSFFLFTSDSNINIKEKKESEVSQSCLTLCGPMDCSPPGSSVHGILQARILEWVAISSPGDLPNPGIDLSSPTLQAGSLLTELQGKHTAEINSGMFKTLELASSNFLRITFNLSKY